MFEETGFVKAAFDDAHRRKCCDFETRIDIHVAFHMPKGQTVLAVLSQLLNI